MGTGVGEVNTDVPMLVIDQQPTVGGKRVFTDGSGQRVPSVLCPTFEELEEYDEQEEDSPNETNMVPERRLHDSKTDIEITPETVLAGRKAEMEEMMNHHVFEEVRESEALKKHP